MPTRNVSGKDAEWHTAQKGKSGNGKKKKEGNGRSLGLFITGTLYRQRASSYSVRRGKETKKALLEGKKDLEHWSNPEYVKFEVEKECQKSVPILRSQIGENPPT